MASVMIAVEKVCSESVDSEDPRSSLVPHGMRLVFLDRSLAQECGEWVENDCSDASAGSAVADTVMFPNRAVICEVPLG